MQALEKLFERLLDHSLLMVEAAPKSNRSGKDNGAYDEDAHEITPFE